ncbi:hypothetical protein E2C01_011632 [Portunus trituberculatus]|uniref:Ig-like domain-containing protein n=1 Tax=Portunus trituberculatus TaxID=210409 RepID=A0A5B7DBN3_PORTR|nr:hypothetical protein [Portunus trituberculatus]
MGDDGYGDYQQEWSNCEELWTVTRTGSSESRVAWTIQASDDGRRLSCTATNPRNSAYAVMNYTTLTVIHPPIVSLSIGRGLDPSSIKEGVDVYFTCSVTANPPPTRITFYHQGEEVQQGKRGAGVVLVTGDSLVLQTGCIFIMSFVCVRQIYLHEEESMEVRRLMTRVFTILIPPQVSEAV